ncbi:MAG: lipoyl synthase, partial [Nevskia sp.]|nr:lipoyl synthase [Nevskia sp.]
MSPPSSGSPPTVVPGAKLRGAEKMARIPVKIEPTVAPLRKPA